VANSEAAYCGYVMGKYKNIHWIMINTAKEYIKMPNMLAIQCTCGLAVHPNKKRPMGKRKDMAHAGMRMFSGVDGSPRFIAGTTTNPQKHLNYVRLTMHISKY